MSVDDRKAEGASQSVNLEAVNFNLQRQGDLTMDTGNEIMRALGRIEGELLEIHKLAERVSRLEQWQAWLKGGWAVLASAFAYVCKAAYEK